MYSIYIWHRAWRLSSWPWSSAAGHVEGRPDALVKDNPLAEEIGD